MLQATTTQYAFREESSASSSIIDWFHGGQLLDPE
jgi:hypothetical protein